MKNISIIISVFILGISQSSYSQEDSSTFSENEVRTVRSINAPYIPFVTVIPKEAISNVRTKRHMAILWPGSQIRIMDPTPHTGWNRALFFKVRVVSNLSSKLDGKQLILKDERVGFTFKSVENVSIASPGYEGFILGSEIEGYYSPLIERFINEAMSPSF